MNPPSDDISKTITELQQVQSLIRSWRSATLVIVIAVLVGGMFMVWQSIKQLTDEGPPQDEFYKELGAGLRADVLPQVRHIGSQTVNRMAPIVETELKKLNARAPEIADAARLHLETLARNVPERAEKTLSASFGDILKNREAKIHQLYPDVTEVKVEAFLKNLGTVAGERAIDLVETQFASHIAGINRIHENLHQIYLSEVGAIQQDVPNWEMALLFFDVIREEVRPLETLEPIKPQG